MKGVERKIAMETINKEIFNALKENMGEIMPELINVFAQESDILFQEIENGIKNKNFEQVLKAAHTLKSSAKNMGADKLTHYAITIENLINSGAEDGLMGIFSEATEEMNNVSKALNELD